MALVLSPKQNSNNAYSVYIHTNKTNGKKYIGITRQNPEKRWQKGYGYIDTVFWNAIKKYGWDGFEHEVIGSGLTKQNACEMEKALIAMHRTQDRSKGYNISDGGNTCDVITGKTGIEHPNHQRVKMIDPKTNEVIHVFGAQAEAARVMGISRKGITKACMGNGSATYKGYIWEYADKKYEKPGNPGVGNYAHTKIQKKIRMDDVDGKTYVFDSIKEAGNTTGRRANTISRYVSGIRNDPSGRRWSYVT